MTMALGVRRLVAVVLLGTAVSLVHCGDDDPETAAIGDPCGTASNLPCGKDAFCKFANNACGVSGAGVCTARPTCTPGVIVKVCGCNKLTYKDNCDANSSGTDVGSNGPCPLAGRRRASGARDGGGKAGGAPGARCSRSGARGRGRGTDGRGCGAVVARVLACIVSNSAGILRYLQAPISFVTGKGGVGKTTVAAAIALTMARAGKRAVLVEFDDAEAGQRALKGADAEVTHEVATYDRCIETTIAPMVGGSMIAKAVLRQKPIKSMTRAMPAMRELVSLERVRSLLSSGDFDRVIVDLPASGHALDWLRVPKAFERFLLGGPLGKIGTRIHDEVVAAGRSDVVFVTLAEPLVMKETEQLAARFHKELGRSPAMVVVNRVMRPDPAGSQEAAARLAQASGAPAAAEFLRILHARADASRETFEALKLAQGLDVAKMVALPEVPTDPPIANVVRWLEDGASR